MKIQGVQKIGKYWSGQKTLWPNILRHILEKFEKNSQFGPSFSSTDAKMTFTGCPKVKFDNLIVPGGPNRYIPHMHTDKTQDLSQKKWFFSDRYFGYYARYPKYTFCWTPCKIRVLAKIALCALFTWINDHFGV